jgi:tetratricopeptide (TPR) repeat protein
MGKSGFHKFILQVKLWINQLTTIQIKKLVLCAAIAVSGLCFSGCAAHTSIKAPPETVSKEGLSKVSPDQPENAMFFYVESQFRRSRGDLEGALAALKKAIEKDPDSLFLKRELIQIYWQKKDSAGAMGVLKELLALDPEDLENLVLYARINHMVKNMGEAKSAYEKVLVKDPQNKGVYLLLGGIYTDEGNLDFAMQIYQKLIRQFPDYFAGYYVMGQTHAAMGDFTKAEEYYVKALELEPSLDDARYELIDMYQRPGKEKEDTVIQIRSGDTIAVLSMKVYGKFDPDIQKAIVRANPGIRRMDRIHVGQSVIFPALAVKKGKAGESDNEKIRYYYNQILENSPDDIRGAMGLGYYEYEAGNYKESERIFKRLGERSQTDHDIVDFVVRYYLEDRNYDAATVILEGMAKGVVDKSELYYLTALAYHGKEDKFHALGYLMRIDSQSKFFEKAVEYVNYLYARDEKIDEAIDYLTRAIEARPENSNFKLYLGKLYEETGEYEKAEKLLEEGIKNDPENPKLYFMIGVIYDKAGKRDDAIDMMKKVLELSPEDATALNYLGYTYADMGRNLEEALQLVEKAMRYKPDDGYITDSLGWVYYRMGDYDKALETLTKAMKLVPDDPTIMEHLGDVYRKKNENDKALEMYRQSLMNEPEDEGQINRKIQEIMDEGK